VFMRRTEGKRNFSNVENGKRKGGAGSEASGKFHLHITKRKGERRGVLDVVPKDKKSLPTNAKAQRDGKSPSSLSAHQGASHSLRMGGGRGVIHYFGTKRRKDRPRSSGACERGRLALPKLSAKQGNSPSKPGRGRKTEKSFLLQLPRRKRKVQGPGPCCGKREGTPNCSP